MKQVIFPGGASGSPDSPEWHAWRAGGIGGSDAPVIGYASGINSKATWMRGQSELWLVKTGQITLPSFSNWATERGRQGEEPARRAFEEATGIILSPMFGEMDAHPPTRASFDGVDFYRTTIGEIKCPGKEIHEEARKGIAPDYYVTQMLHQGLTLWGPPADGGWTGKRFFFISYVPEIADLVWVEFPADSLEVLKKADQLLMAEMAFWKHVENKTEPEGDAWVQAANDYIAANLALELAKATLESAKLRVDLLVGDRKSAEGAGISASRSTRAGSMSYKDAAETLMRWYGVDPNEFLPAFQGEVSESFQVRVKGASRKKTKAEGDLSLEAARAESARIAAAEAETDQKSFAW